MKIPLKRLRDLGFSEWRYNNLVYRLFTCKYTGSTAGYIGVKYVTLQDIIHYSGDKCRGGHDSGTRSGVRGLREFVALSIRDGDIEPLREMYIGLTLTEREREFFMKVGADSGNVEAVRYLYGIDCWSDYPGNIHLKFEYTDGTSDRGVWKTGKEAVDYLKIARGNKKEKENQ